MSPPSLNEDLLDRYLAGHTTAAETDQVQAQLTTHPVAANTVTWLQSQLAQTPQPPSTATAWSRLEPHLTRYTDFGIHWWTYTAQWAKSVIVCGVAASLVAIATIGITSFATFPTDELETSSFSLLSAVTNDVPEQPLIDLATRPSNADWFTAAVR